jgi:quercetin dioxygenase-like cupin family protein
MQHLRSAVARLALRPDTWSPLVRHDPGRRIYEEIFRDDELSAWLICWMPGHDTGFHDHAGSSGAVTVVAGTVLEQRISSLGNPVGSVHSRGEVFDFDPGVIHRVRHHGVGPATTLHAYSPPLTGMGVYVERDGRLQREELSEAQELRPLDGIA